MKKILALVLAFVMVLGMVACGGSKEPQISVFWYDESDVYLSSVRTALNAELDKLGIKYYGGKNSPYIWLKCPGGMKSWEFFDLMLTKCNVVGTPGQGFGENGEGYFRLSGFGDQQRTLTALERIEKLLGQ